MLRNLRFTLNLIWGSILVRRAIKLYVRIKFLDENYLVSELIVLGEPCWLDAYMLNKLISYLILFERFVLIIIGVAIIAEIQFLLNQPILST